MTKGFTSMGKDGRASLVRLIRHVSSKLLDPLSSAVRPDRKERVSVVGALGAPFLDLDFLGAMVQREARGRGMPEKCSGGGM
jgi:hypothetical protein